MSKYTTEVRFICETYAGNRESVGYDSINEVISKAIPKVFSFNFPIFDEAYREVLCTKILKHYYTREICEESVGLWKLRLDTKLNEIMPYYNKLYESELYKFNPLYDIDLTTTHDGKKKEEVDTTGEGNYQGNRNTANQGNSEDWNVYSDTPQGTLNNVKNEAYLTNATKDTNTYNNTSNTNDNNTTNTKENKRLNNTDNYIEHVAGKTGGVSYSHLLKEFRETFLNIDLMIIEELQPLFFGLW